MSPSAVLVFRLFSLTAFRGTYLPDRISCRSCNTNRYLLVKINRVRGSHGGEKNINQLSASLVSDTQFVFNKSLSIWPWFESAHSSRVISPASPPDLGAGLRRTPRVYSRVSLICLLRVLPCKFFAQIVWLRRVKFHSEKQPVWRPVWRK